jgi:hypothetical protein
MLTSLKSAQLCRLGCCGSSIGRPSGWLGTDPGHIVMPTRGRIVSLRCEGGDPTWRVAQIADWQPADLIALVSLGCSDLTRFRRGSVATSTLRYTHVPVLIAKSGVAPAAVTRSPAQAPHRRVTA